MIRCVGKKKDKSNIVFH